MATYNKEKENNRIECMRQYEEGEITFLECINYLWATIDQDDIDLANQFRESDDPVITLGMYGK